MEYIKKDPRIFEEQKFRHLKPISCLYSTVYETFDVTICVCILQKNNYLNCYLANFGTQILLNFKYLL